MNKIKNKNIRFKSTPVNWNKERTIKRNTVRKRDPKESNDERFDILDGWIAGKVESLTVEIENTASGRIFSRRALDVTKWEGNYIISW